MLGPKSPSKQVASSQDDDKITKQNIEDLARIIASEARGPNETAQTMVGWTVVNRMKKHHFKMVSSVWANHRYAHGYPPTTTSRRIASAILTGKEKIIVKALFFSIHRLSCQKKEIKIFPDTISRGIRNS